MNDILLNQSSEFDSEIVLDPKVHDKAIYEKESTLLYDIKNYVKTDIKTYTEGLAFACLDKLYKTASPFQYYALENNKLVQYKIPYYDNVGYSVQNLFFTFKVGAYDQSEGEAFRGIVDGATRRHSAVFLYFRDDTQSVNAYARMFEWYQVEGMGLSRFCGLHMGFDNQVLPLAFVLKWDTKKNTYASKSTKTAYDAYRFFLEKSGVSGSRLGQPLYMFYAKLSDGSEVVDWGDFEPATVKSDATFVREMKAKDVYFYGNYFARLGIAFRKRFNTARAELVRSLPDGKSSFWSNINMRIDKAPDMLEELRTGTFYYVDQAYVEAIIKLSERTGVPVVLRKSVNNIKTDDIPNNMEQIKWQPPSANKLSECVTTVQAFVNKCVFGPYAASISQISSGSVSVVDSKTIDSCNNLIMYLPECGCILADVVCDIPYDTLGLDSQTERKKILQWYNQLFYVCHGGKCVASTDLLSVLASLGMTLSFNYRYLKDQVPYVNYLDSITYSGGNVTYNNVEGGTTWWYNNIDQIRDTFVSWFMENIPSKPEEPEEPDQFVDNAVTLSFDPNGGEGYVMPITVGSGVTDGALDSDPPGTGSLNDIVVFPKDGVVTDFRPASWYKALVNGVVGDIENRLASTQNFFAYAKRHGHPIFILQSSSGCEKCDWAYVNIFSNSVVNEFFVRNRMMLLYLYSGSGWWSGDLYKWIMNELYGKDNIGFGMPMSHVLAQDGETFRFSPYGMTVRQFTDKVSEFV